MPILCGIPQVSGWIGRWNGCSESSQRDWEIIAINLMKSVLLVHDLLPCKRDDVALTWWWLSIPCMALSPLTQEVLVWNCQERQLAVTEQTYLYIYRAINNIVKNSFKYRISKSWNCFSVAAKTTENLRFFKRLI